MLLVCCSLSQLLLNWVCINLSTNRVPMDSTLGLPSTLLLVTIWYTCQRVNKFLAPLPGTLFFVLDYLHIPILKQLVFTFYFLFYFLFYLLLFLVASFYFSIFSFYSFSFFLLPRVRITVSQDFGSRFVEWLDMIHVGVWFGSGIKGMPHIISMTQMQK